MLALPAGQRMAFLFDPAALHAFFTASDEQITFRCDTLWFKPGKSCSTILHASSIMVMNTVSD